MITLTTTAKLQQLRVNSREMTTFAASCNDREMQRTRSDKLETAQLLQILRKILCRFMAVVVSSAFWKSLSKEAPEFFDKIKAGEFTLHTEPHFLR